MFENSELGRKIVSHSDHASFYLILTIFFYASTFTDGKETIKDLSTNKMVPKRPVGNVYINDRDKQQHQTTLGHKPV